MVIEMMNINRSVHVTAVLQDFNTFNRKINKTKGSYGGGICVNVTLSFC